MILSHLSPHWCPPYDLYCGMAEKENMIVSYDGMELEV